MSNQKPVFIEGEIYHVYNRGVEKRDIFLNERDYIRFAYNMFVCNGQKNMVHLKRMGMSEINFFLQEAEMDNSTQLVEILSFVFMPNHFHIVLKQLTDGGIVKFMQKLGTSTTMCFNKKYERVGPLFQGNFKAVRVENDEHFYYISHYIHLNPLSLMSGDPRYAQTNDKVLFLKNYRWSSLPDYLGKNNFSNIFNKDFFLNKAGGKDKYKKEMERIIKVDEIESCEISSMIDFGTNIQKEGKKQVDLN